MLNEEIDDKDLNLKDDDKELDDKEDKEDKGDDKDKGNDNWKDKQKVPYRRLEAQSRKAQKLEKDLEDLKEKFESLPNKSTDTKQGVWDNRVKNAQSWDEVFNELPNQFLKVLLGNPEMKAQFVNSIKSDLKNEDKQIEEKVTQEIDSLWDKDIITSKDEENRVIKYAIKESEETGDRVSLAVAVRMMKKEGVWKKKLEDRKDANNKVRAGHGGNNVDNSDKPSYGKWKHNSVDSIVADAVSKFNK